MDVIVKARGLQKSYGDLKAIDNIDLDLAQGRILGVIGPNGAGKTTLLKAILGLVPVVGQLEVLGLHPHKQRTQLLENVSFIADTAILPRWMKVAHAVEYMTGVHSKFDREKALAFLSRTNISLKSTVGKLSKGMVTQLHLALIMAVDAKLLVLDEPTLGLDIIHRKDFYANLLGEYFDQEKTIIITTHQVEEIENILTDVVFVDQGRLILNEVMDEIPQRYAQMLVSDELVEKLRSLNPLYESKMFGGTSFIFSRDLSSEFDTLPSLGKVTIPSVADLFLAKVKGQRS